MKLTILFLLFALTNTFAQTKDNSFSIKIVATTNNVNAFIFNIVERTDSIKIRYSILDSIRLESLRKDPEYINIHNIGSTFTVNTDTIIQEKIYKALAVITDKYRVYNVDSIRFSLTEYPNYKKLLDSAYNGINFSDKKDRVVFDGVKYSVTISSAKINRTLYSNTPDDNSNPTLYHLINTTSVIYNKQSKNPLVYHLNRDN